MNNFLSILNRNGDKRPMGMIYGKKDMSMRFYHLNQLPIAYRAKTTSPHTRKTVKTVIALFAVEISCISRKPIIISTIEYTVANKAPITGTDSRRWGALE
jgi:hypothetical protein